MAPGSGQESRPDGTIRLAESPPHDRGTRSSVDPEKPETEISDDSQNDRIINPDTQETGDDTLARTVSSVSVAPPPDGGLAACLTVFSGHLVIMCTWGVINSFGAFQTYYSSTLDRTPSDISWIGSFQIFLLFFVGTFAGRLTDAGFFRPCMISGICFEVVGTFTAAQSTQYWQLFLSQGICVGLGNGLLFCPTVAVISTYWHRKRALAIGIAAAGSGTGGIIFPSMVRQLLPKVGFAWTMRSIGFLQLGCLLVSLLFLKTRVPPRSTGKLIDVASFSELEYTFYAVGTFLCFWGFYFPFFYIASYSRDKQGLSYAASLDLLLVLNGVGVVGRVVPNFLADKLGTFNLFVPIAAVTTLMIYCWPAVRSAAGLYAWACIYGVAAGGISSLFPAALSTLTADLRKLGTRMGMVFTIVSFAVLTGPPITGVIITSLEGRYIGAQMFAGSSMALGTGFVYLSAHIKRRKTGKSLLSKI